MRVEFYPACEIEIRDARDYYELIQSGLGYRMLDELDVVIQGIVNWPNAHLEVIPGVRRALIRKFPYYLAYRVQGENIELIAFVSRHRKPIKLKNRLK